MTPRARPEYSWINRRLREGETLHVLGGQAWRLRNGPRNGQLRIVPRNAPLMLGRVVVGGLIKEVGRFAEHHEPVRKALLLLNLVLVVLGKLRAYPLAKGR